MESTMKSLYYIGVDFHPYQQTVAYCNSSDGEIKYRQFFHSDKKALRNFYQKFDKHSLIGVEATGTLYWFEKMLFDIGLSLKIGNPKLIRRMALSRHKNDYRDAETILDLLINNHFPEIQKRNEYSLDILQMLNYRHSLVRQRTVIANQLQAFARAKGLTKFQIKSKSAKLRLSEAASRESEYLLVRSRQNLFDYLSQEIEKLQTRLRKQANQDAQARLLLTHSGIGDLTALAVVHTLGDVRRFNRKEQVVAFIGLDPLDKSSGERKRIGRISKHGSRLVRFLLVQAANTTRDKRLREFYQRVSRRRGKPKAKIAVARKLLINSYIMLRDEIDYPEFCRRGEVDLCG